jgi:hypothetical protein
MLALCNENRVWHEYEKAWRDYVIIQSHTSLNVWSNLRDCWRDAMDHREATRKAWERVAYPLYDMPFVADEKSS